MWLRSGRPMRGVLGVSLAICVMASVSACPMGDPCTQNAGIAAGLDASGNRIFFFEECDGTGLLAVAGGPGQGFGQASFTATSRNGDPIDEFDMDSPQSAWVVEGTPPPRNAEFWISIQGGLVKQPWPAAVYKTLPRLPMVAMSNSNAMGDTRIVTETEYRRAARASCVPNS